MAASLELDAIDLGDAHAGPLRIPARGLVIRDVLALIIAVGIGRAAAGVEVILHHHPIPVVGAPARLAPPVHLVVAYAAVGAAAADVEEVRPAIDLAEFELGGSAIHQADGHVLVGPFGPVVLVGHDGAHVDRPAIGSDNRPTGGVVADALGLQDGSVADDGRVVRLADIPGRHSGHNIGLDSPAAAGTRSRQDPGAVPQVAAGLIGETPGAQVDVRVGECLGIHVCGILRRRQPVHDQPVRVEGIRLDTEDTVVVRCVCHHHMFLEVGGDALVHHRGDVGADGNHISSGIAVRVGARIG